MNHQPRGAAVRKRDAWRRRESWPLAVIAFGNACGIRVVEPNARGTAVSELGSGVVAATPVRTAPASDDAVTRIDVALAYKRWCRSVSRTMRTWTRGSASVREKIKMSSI